MVINIPVQVDEAKMEEVIQRDYEERVLKMISEYLRTALSRKSRYYGDDKDGMLVVVQEQIDIFIDNHKDDILEIAGRHLADKLARTKAAKQLIENLNN